MALQIAPGTLALAPRLKILAPWPVQLPVATYYYAAVAPKSSKFSVLSARIDSMQVNMVNVDEL